MFVTIIALLGLQESVPTFISRFRAMNELKKIKSTVFSSFKIVSLSSLFFAGLVFIFSELIATKFFNDERLIPVLRVFAVIIPFFSLSLLLLSYLRGFKLIKQMVYSRNLFGNTSLILFLIVFFAFGYRLYGAILSHLIQYILIIFFALYFFRKSDFFPSKKVKFAPITKELMSFSLPLTGSGSLERLRMWTDTFLVGFFLSSAHVGLFNYALVISIILVVITASFIVILLPINSELYASNNKNEMNRLYYTVSKWLFFILFPLFLVIFFFPETIVSIVFGSEYVGVAKILRILSCGYFVNASFGIWITIIYAIGKTKIDLYLKIIAIVSNIVLSIILIPRLGLIGAAISHTFSVLLLDCLGVGMVYYYTKMWPLSFRFLKYFSFSFIIFLVFYFIVKNNSAIVSSNILMLLSFVVYFLINSITILKLIGLEKEDRLIIDSLKKRLYR